MGNILTGIFAQASVAGFDGITTIPGGWLDGHWVQLGIQLADSTAGMSYSFVMTVSFFFLFLFSALSEKLTILVLDYHPLDHALHPWLISTCERTS